MNIDYNVFVILGAVSIIFGNRYLKKVYIKLPEEQKIISDKLSTRDLIGGWIFTIPLIITFINFKIIYFLGALFLMIFGHIIMSIYVYKKFKNYGVPLKYIKSYIIAHLAGLIGILIILIPVLYSIFNC